MFNPTASAAAAHNQQQSTNAAAAAIFSAYLDDSLGSSERRNPPPPHHHQQPQQFNMAAAILLEQQQQHQLQQQQQRPSSAHSSLLMHQQQQQPQMQPLSSRKLFIGGLGQINDDTLRQFYAQWGQVVDCIVIRDPTTRSSRGFGFVTYATAEMADVAISNRPHIINGKAVDAKRAVPREKMNLIVDNDQPPVFLSLEPAPGCRLQLSGLNWEWHTLDTLRTYFEKFGPVEQLEMVAYPRGYGSLAFETEEAVERCMAIGPVHSVNGHPVEIKIATADSLVFHPREGSRDQQQQSRPATSTPISAHSGAHGQGEGEGELAQSRPGSSEASGRASTN